MDSYQNLLLLNNLYRLKALGHHYIDPYTPINIPVQNQALPSTLEELNRTISECHLCDLCKSRHQSMSGFGHSHAKVFFVDGYISAAEDESNRYYVGRSGTMLRDMIEKVLGVSIEDVYLTHALKCKPFGYQIPSSSEYTTCLPYLMHQRELIAPTVIVTLGEEAYLSFYPDASDFEKVRGHTLMYQNTTLVPMYHPSHLIRNPSLKKEALRDLQTIKGLLG